MRARSTTPTAACRCTSPCSPSRPRRCCARCSLPIPKPSRTPTPTACCRYTWRSSTRRQPARARPRLALQPPRLQATPRHA
eukprot:scaffold27256_cov56-Phaeocystis_antarctica.AAC.2